MQSPLQRLLRDLPGARIEGDPATPISSIVTDSRRAVGGALFVCLPGVRQDGHAHAREALDRGAAAVLAQSRIDAGAGATVAYVDDTLSALSPVAAEFFGRPSQSLVCIGVTGTNGKTTTTHLLEAVMRAAGTPFGLIGTLGARLAGRFEAALEHTTPPAPQLQKLLAAFADEGAAGAICEVSSHALVLHRVDDVAFDVAILTNVTHDHLDFHGGMESYRAAKKLLFDAVSAGLRKPVGTCVLNVDDEFGRSLAASTRRKLTYAVDNAEALLRATDIRPTSQGSTFMLRDLRPVPFRLRLPGRFNVANALAAIAGACALDVEVEAIAEGIESVSEVPGRMMAVSAGPFAVYVDYAHTPNGLQRVLESARSLTVGRLICVFGCGGDRDRSKRPAMGDIASRLADIAVLTTDNPRFEDPDRIIEEIASGASIKDKLRIQLDRAEAIGYALAEARAGDVVVIAGKGHESYQSVRGEQLPFSDAAVAKSALQALAS
ncbi:MAG: UDP-N-acetylmuramoyl-L-alanyl-D-glutamate--2,6-diaminopimelate ligase [Candidatus Eremiobacteraeota bacterium]|nr:UDP-N-acetylmuramoyl-L-alanyl-D-glutamate--2,6-diaminopimelate ligase [Candidatus Eremiobacteraeota bacterium]